MHLTEPSDAELVAEALDGRLSAFRMIVERYQALICAIAYSSTGNVSRSEDVAQETFVTAWKELRSLRETSKLRSWLCGIVRNRIHRDWREHRREPVSVATGLERAHEIPALEPIPSEQAVSREEEAILWRSLEKIPASYREPLILFYREEQSIARVAAGLQLSEEVVKQRLSRGRKLLQNEVQSAMENTLRRTAPSRAFSATVLTMLPAAAGPALATVGVGAGAKGTAMAKSGWLAVVLVPLAPFLGIAAGVVAHWLVIRDTTADRRLRARKILQVAGGWVLYLALAVFGEAAIHALARAFGWPERIRFGAVAGFWWWFITSTVTLQIVVIRRIQAREGPPLERGASGLLSMRGGTLAAVVAGAHAALFTWLVALAWRYHDQVGAALAGGAMLGLGLLAFFRFRSVARPGLARALCTQAALAGATILLIVNLRAAAWVANGHGVSVAEAWSIQPLWIIPTLTLALVVWTWLVIVRTRPTRKE